MANDQTTQNGGQPAPSDGDPRPAPKTTTRDAAASLAAAAPVDEALAVFEVAQTYDTDQGDETAAVTVVVLQPVGVARSRSGRRKSDDAIPAVTALLGNRLELHVHEDSALADLEAGDRVGVRLAVQVL